MIFLITGILVSYLLGTIPTGLVFGKILKNIDIREHGSGNIGATNVFRTVGKVPGIIALLIDAAKGYAAVVFVPVLINKVAPGALDKYMFSAILFGSAAIIGHIFNIFFKFEGGKGVATTAGVLAGMDMIVLLISLTVFIITVVISKYVSLSSLCAALALPVSAALLTKELYVVVFYCLLSFTAVMSHRSNIRRLIRGEENKIA